MNQPKYSQADIDLEEKCSKSIATREFTLLLLLFLVCAEAYNPDEEEDDTESRVSEFRKKYKYFYA